MDNSIHYGYGLYAKVKSQYLSTLNLEKSGEFDDDYKRYLAYTSILHSVTSAIKSIKQLGDDIYLDELRTYADDLTARLNDLNVYNVGL